MRIYELAKELGKQFGIDIKSSDLAHEMQSLRELDSDVRESIKSHASSVTDEVVDKMIRVYKERIEAPAQRAAEEEQAKRKAEEAKRREEIRLRREQLEQQKRRDGQGKLSDIEQTRRAREQEIQRRQALTGIPPLGTPLPRPTVAGVGIRPPGIGGAIPLPPRKAAATVSPSAAAPNPPGPAVAQTTAAAPSPQASVTPQTPPPIQTIAPKTGIRPTGTATQLKSSSGSSGFSSGPVHGGTGADSGRTGVRTDGQPPPPAAPQLRADSPFRMRPQQQRPSVPGTLPGRNEYNRSSGPSQGHGRSDGPRRPDGPPGQREYQRPDSGGPRRPSRPDDRPSDRPSDRSGRPPERSDRPDRGAPRSSQPSDRKSGELIIPEIEVMTLKGAVRRPRTPGDKAKAPAPKKKILKTIVREEIEVKPSRIYGLADEFRRPIGGKRPKSATRATTQSDRHSTAKSAPSARGPVRIGSTITVGEFAERLRVPAADIIKQVFLMGKPLTINHLIDPDLCEIIAQEYGVPLEIEAEGDEQDIAQYIPVEDESHMVPQAPVVTIMGHVDHGKTTLLDAYRSSTVAAGEFGGITQHIGAYRVETPRGVITFLDTPGHEAFTSMRARGAQVTDIVVLVVGADDGVMPQTVEAINHAREAGVPIIVAINKIDLPSANPQRVRTELMQHSILPESLGGTNIFVEISAKKRINLDELLEMILLQAEILELKTDPTCRAEGTIIESHVDPLRGPVATVLVEKGTLHQGDIFVVGTESGRTRVMINDRGQQVREAGPSVPVEVIGLTGSPDVGETFLVMAEERIAREIASRRVDRRRMRDLGTTRHVTLEGLHELVAEGKLKDLKIILKADVQGSIEAISQSLQKLSNEQVKVRILHKSTGGITESDVNLAHASDAIVIGFNVRPDPAASTLAQREGVEIRNYRIIYELIEELQKAIVGMLDKVYKETVTGRAQIRQIFKMSRIGNIAGCYVLDGEIIRGNKARLVRNSIVVWEGKLSTLRRVKDDVSKVAAGFECGLTLESFQDIKEGDIVESFQMEEVPAELAASG